MEEKSAEVVGTADHFDLRRSHVLPFRPRHWSDGAVDLRGGGPRIVERRTRAASDVGSMGPQERRAKGRIVKRAVQLADVAFLLFLVVLSVVVFAAKFL